MSAKKQFLRNQAVLGVKNHSYWVREGFIIGFAIKKFHQPLWVWIHLEYWSQATNYNPRPKEKDTTISHCPATEMSLTTVRIQFCPTKAHANADALSHLWLQSTDTKRQPETDNFAVWQIETLPITSAQLKCVTGHDPILSKVLWYTEQGWPDKV